jgi:hypothetical protein
MKINCDHCGKEFDKKPSRIKRAKKHYCSKLCTTRASSVAVKCHYCGKTLRKQLSKWEATEKHFCNEACAGLSTRVRDNRKLLDPQLVVDKLRAAAIYFVSHSAVFTHDDIEELMNKAYISLYQGKTKRALTPRRLYYQCSMAVLRVAHKHDHNSLDVYIENGLEKACIYNGFKDVDNKEYAQHLLASSGLTARERQVVNMRFTERLGFVAIGEKIGFTRTTAQNVLNKALGKMRHNTI